MPFTISHIAAVYPFRRFKRFKTQFDALVLGSLMPDLIYFFPLNRGRDFSHSLQGLILFSLPAGLVLLLLMRTLFRAPLLSLLPSFIQNRIGQEKRDGLRVSSLLFSVLALSLGICSHLLWDAFTHGESLFSSVNPGGYNFYLQFFSSVFGLIFILVWFLAWLKNTPVVPAEPDVFPLHLRIARGITITVPLILTVLLALMTMEMNSKRDIVHHFSMWVFFGGGFILTVLFTVYSVLFFFYQRRLLFR